MATCPNCGEIVMNGDPYCLHCGATLRWHFDDEEDDEDEPPEEDRASDLYKKLFHEMLNSGLTTDEKFDLFRKYLFTTDYIFEEIRQEIHDEEKRYKCKFMMVHTADFPYTYVFLRQDKFRDVLIFERCHIEYTPGRFDPERQEFHYAYAKLYENAKFQSEVERIENSGLRFKEVRSDIRQPLFEDDLRVIFTDGNADVTYGIDDDLNFRKIM